MKRKDIQDLRAKSKIELLKIAQELSVEISKLKMDMTMKKVKNINEYRTKMKDRARVLTFAHMKKEEAENA